MEIDKKTNKANNVTTNATLLRTPKASKPKAAWERDYDFIDEIRTSSIETLRTRLSEGARVNARDMSKRTALMWAAWNCRHELVPILIEKGAKINARDKDGRTALIYATLNDDVTMAQILIAGGANVNLREKHSRWTALKFANVYGYRKVADELKKHGARE